MFNPRKLDVRGTGTDASFFPYWMTEGYHSSYRNSEFTGCILCKLWFILSYVNCSNVTVASIWLNELVMVALLLSVTCFEEINSVKNMKVATKLGVNCFD